MGELHHIDDRVPPPPSVAPCVLVVGNFDGVHQGHAAVLREAVTVAQERDLGTSVLTFEPHPAAVVGHGAPPLLTTPQRRAQLMAAMGVERVWVRRFDANFAAWSPHQFAQDLVSRALAARAVVVGQNFRFGARREGDLEVLRRMGKDLGFDVCVHAIASDLRGPYSSTRAREAIGSGDLEEAAHVLGRPHELSGLVAKGDQRGRTLGFPTANLVDIPEMLPPDGVYATRVARVDDAGSSETLAGGVTNIGVRPTVGGASRTIETHLLGFAGDLYDAHLRLALVTRLRSERRFGSLEELKTQIGLDAAAARGRLGL
jgi:riboflavin kinase/FMN adenylyltransferase